MPNRLAHISSITNNGPKPSVGGWESGNTPPEIGSDWTGPSQGVRAAPIINPAGNNWLASRSKGATALGAAEDLGEPQRSQHCVEAPAVIVAF